MIKPHGYTIDTNIDEFELRIENIINPKDNSSLEGLYLQAGAYCTQCEAEGFRKITYFLDRPDVLATYEVKIIADKKRFPFLLSNGNKVDSGDLTDGKHWIKWSDPFKKPCYLFALVAGDFDLLEDSFITQSGMLCSAPLLGLPLQLSLPVLVKLAPALCLYLHGTNVNSKHSYIHEGRILGDQ